MDMDLYRLAAVDNCSVHICEGKIIFCLVPIQLNVKKENLRFKKIYMNQAIAKSINNTPIRIFLLHLKYNTEIVIALCTVIINSSKAKFIEYTYSYRNTQRIHVSPLSLVDPNYLLSQCIPKSGILDWIFKLWKKDLRFRIFFITFALKVLQCRLRALIKHRVKFAINVMFFP